MPDTVKSSVTLTSALATSIQEGVASLLNLPISDVSTPSLTFISSPRRLLTTYTVSALYTVTTQNVAASAIQSNLASSNGITALTTSLSASGFSGLSPQAVTYIDKSPTQAPVSSNTDTGALQSSSGGDGGSSGCFAGSETVSLESGEIKFISEVVVGDCILSSDAVGKLVYSEVVAVPHAKNDIQSRVIHLVTESGRDLKMTFYHILPAGACSASGSSLSLVYATVVKAGDCIKTVDGLEKVVEVKKSMSKGMYTVVTMEEFVVVNGIVASPFAISHVFANVYYNLYRMLYASFPWYATKSVAGSLHVTVSG